MKTHTPVYRPILKHALETAWHHRELWPVAALAGLAGTGAVINDVIQQAKLAAALPRSSFLDLFGNLRILKVYEENVVLATPEQITLASIGLIVAFILLATLVVACQQIILRTAHRAATKKTRLTWREMAKELWHPRLLRFFTLDIFLKLMGANLMIATTVLVGNLQASTIVADAFFGTIFSAAALSLTLTLNVVVMLALVGVARRDYGLSEALMYAWKLYRKHPVICLEMSLLLFAVNFAMSAAYDGAILVLGVPALYSFAGAVQAGSLVNYLIISAIASLIVVTVTVAFAGFATTFTYATWTALAEYLDKRKVVPRVVIHTKRFVEHLRA